MLPELSSEDFKTIQSWLSFPVTERDLVNFFYNQTLYPQRVPTDRRSLEIVAARIRVEMKQSLTDEEGDTLVVTDRLLADLPSVQIAALVVLDAFEPEGVLPLVRVSEDQDEEEMLGTVIAFTDVVDDTVARITVENQAGEPLADLDVPAGELAVLPVEEGSLVLEVSCIGDAHLGGEKNVTADVVGGTVGIVIDARGRPIEFPTRLNKRQEVVGRWLEVFL